MKFYTDEHIPRAVITETRRQGVDILSTPEAKMRGAADVDHLRLAASLGRVLVTQDDDYLRLHASGLHHSGIAYIQPQTPIGSIIEWLLLMTQASSSAEMVDYVLYL